MNDASDSESMPQLDEDLESLVTDDPWALVGFAHVWIIFDLVFSGLTFLSGFMGILLLLMPDSPPLTVLTISGVIATFLAGISGITAGMMLLEPHPNGLAVGWITLALVTVCCLAVLLQLPYLSAELKMAIEHSQDRLSTQSSIAVSWNTVVMVAVVAGVILRIGLNVVYVMVLRRIAAQWKLAQTLSPRPVPRR